MTTTVYPHDVCAQGSSTWYDLRAGLITASHFKDLVEGPRGGKPKTRRSYLLRLAGERLTGEPIETFRSGHMERGQILEDEARDFYALASRRKVERVGFITRETSSGLVGCSPDSLVDADGALEIKTQMPLVMLEAILADEAPAEFKPQLQGVLWIAERDWIDLNIYWPSMPVEFTKRIYRDEPYIATLERVVDFANAEIAEMVDTALRYGRPPEERLEPLREALEKSAAAINAEQIAPRESVSQAAKLAAAALLHGPEGTEVRVGEPFRPEMPDLPEFLRRSPAAPLEAPKPKRERKKKAPEPELYTAEDERNDNSGRRWPDDAPQQCAPGWERSPDGGYYRPEDRLPPPLEERSADELAAMAVIAVAAAEMDAPPPAPAGADPELVDMHRRAAEWPDTDPDFQRGRRDAANGLSRCLNQAIKDDPARLERWRLGFESHFPGSRYT